MIAIPPFLMLATATESLTRPRMRRIVYDEYGSPDVLQLQETDRPVARDDGVLVRVGAAATNPYDWHFLRGEPY